MKTKQPEWVTKLTKDEETISDFTYKLSPLSSYRGFFFGHC